jgi:hypothetical protein
MLVMLDICLTDMQLDKLRPGDPGTLQIICFPQIFLSLWLKMLACEMDGWIGGWMDEWTDGWMNRYVDKEMGR